MNPRKEFDLFVPFGDWYENYWLRPEPVTQSTGFSHRTGIMTMAHRATQLAFHWPACVQRRDEVTPGANPMLTSSVVHGVRKRDRSET
jgi:hypothetical protein